MSSRSPAATTVGNGVIGVLREERPGKLATGLGAYIKAAKANVLFEGRDPKKDGAKAYRPRRYKARP